MTRKRKHYPEVSATESDTLRCPLRKIDAFDIQSLAVVLGAASYFGEEKISLPLNNGKKKKKKKIVCLKLNTYSTHNLEFLIFQTNANFSYTHIVCSRGRCTPSKFPWVDYYIS